MTDEIRFYHLQRSRLEEALPQLLQRTLAKGWRAVVKAGSPERVDALNQQLWTYDESSFLPHGSAKDGDGPSQPVWLTAEDDRPNEAQVLMLVDGAHVEPEVSNVYALVCHVFDGNDPEALDAARATWKQLQATGVPLTYWQQTPEGWQKKA